MLFRSYVNFAFDNIFNMDETALFWRQHLTRTLGKGQASGRKKQMERVTLGFACNATGTEKLRAIVVGKSVQPRCFKNKGDSCSVNVNLGMD